MSEVDFSFDRPFAENPSCPDFRVFQQYPDDAVVQDRRILGKSMFFGINTVAKSNQSSIVTLKLGRFLTMIAIFHRAVLLGTAFVFSGTASAQGIADTIYSGGQIITINNAGVTDDNTTRLAPGKVFPVLFPLITNLASNTE